MWSIFQKEKNMDVIRKHIVFYGRVQGVGFRYYSTYKARELGLTGWVTNLYDGSVEMEVQGDPKRINELLEYLHQQRFVEILNMDARNIEPIEEYGFETR